MPRDEDGDRILARLAAALGVDIKDFLDLDAQDEHQDTLALLRSWYGVTDRQGRARILSLARKEASRCEHDAGS